MLDAAYDLLLDVGIRGFTLLEVASRAGVPKSTVYRRWPTRRDMLAAAFTRLATDEPQRPDTGSVRGDLVALVEQHAQQSDQASAIVCISLEANADPELRPVVRAALERRRRSLYPVFERAIARGELRPEVDIDDAIDLVFGAVWSRVISQRGDFEPGAAEDIVDRALWGLAASPR